LARRLLSDGAALALFVLVLASACKRDHPAPAPAPAPPDSATESARQLRFDSELKRSHARWQEHPNLGNCAEILHEKADAELCRAASSALGAIAALDPQATPDRVLPVLADGSLMLVRLLERARYLNFEDLGRRRLDGDAGAPAPIAASARPATPGAPAVSVGPQNMQRALHGLLHEHQSLKLADSPLSRLVQDTARLERDVLRNLAAYLEYGALPVRQAAFEVAKGLHAQHLQWPALNHVLREAAVLETNATLKQNLSELANQGRPRGNQPDQPTGSK
jgi:hypothetical protein